MYIRCKKNKICVILYLVVKMKIKHILILFVILLITAGILLLAKFAPIESVPEIPEEGYVASEELEVVLYDEEYNESINLIRGSKVYVYSNEITNEEDIYKKVLYDDIEYLVKVNNIVEKESDVVKEKELYVRTSTTIIKI